MTYPVTIDLDERMHEEFRRAANDHGRSLEAEVRVSLAKVRPSSQRLTSEELRALSERLWAMTPDSAAAVDSTDLIRADRDER